MSNVMADIDLIAFNIKLTIDNDGDIEIGVYKNSVYHKKTLSKHEAEHLIRVLKLVK